MFRRLKLFHRIVLHSVIMTLAIALSSVVVFHLVGTPVGLHNALPRAASALVKSLEATDGSKAALDPPLRRFYDIIQSDIAIYDINGVPVTHLGDKQIPPLPKAAAAALINGTGRDHKRFGEMAFPLRLASGPAYLVISWVQAEEMRLRFIIGILVAMVVIGLMSIPLARSIARPVKALTETAAQLRDGRLDTRAAVQSSDELAVLGNTLNDMAAGITQHIRREKELLANVSHELRTPLARIRVALEIAEESMDDSELVTRQLAEIGTDVKELEQLVGDVLFSTKLDFSDSKQRTALPLSPVPTPLIPYLEGIIERFEASNDLSVTKTFPSTEDGPVVGIDGTLFKRAVDNLLVNSLKYSLASPEISVAVRVADGVARISVADRGMGVSDPNLSRLFEPFFRTDTSRSQNAGGMGLGLTLTKRIVDAHGGKISATQRDGGGLAVEIRLPVATA